MTGTGFVRVAVERRIVSELAKLDGFSSTPDDDALWWVTSPVNGTLRNRRVLVIGIYDGTVESDSNQRSHGPSRDDWVTRCGAMVLGIEDALAAKDEVEAAVNQIADYLASNHRLQVPGQPILGCHDLMIEDYDGPYWSWEKDAPPIAWASFTIGGQATFRREP